MKRWRFWVIFWPLCCLTLTGVMLYQWSAGMAYRDPVHAVFPIFSLLFFFIGMGMKKNSAKHREVATRLAPDATVAYLNTRRGNHGTVKPPVYRYTAGEISYTVSSRSSYSPCPVHTGEAVELYYSPRTPGPSTSPRRSEPACGGPGSSAASGWRSPSSLWPPLGLPPGWRVCLSLR